jgi:TPR repeat protein
MKKLLSHFLTAALLLVVIAVYAQKEQRSEAEEAEQLRFLELARNYLFGLNGQEIDYNLAIDIYFYLIRLNNEHAFYSLGNMYLTGTGIKQNDSLAMYYFHNAVERGSGMAAKRIAEVNMRNGRWATYEEWYKLTQEVIPWIEKAVGFGSSEGYYTLGHFYFKGFGVEQSYRMAVEYFGPAAEVGHLKSCFMVGFCYLNGYGYERNLDYGKAWMQYAADRGHRPAINLLDRMKKTDNSARLMVNTDDKFNQKLEFPEELNNRTPQRFKQLPNNVEKHKIHSDNSCANTVTTISGCWSGKLITYEWSGETIIDEQEIDLSINESSGELYGSWKDYQNEIFIRASLQDTLWVFSPYTAEEYKLGNQSVVLKFATLNYECTEDEEFLSGNLWRYSYQTTAFLPPSVMLLKKSDNQPAITTGNKDNNEDATSEEEVLDSKSIIVYPNPFSDLLNLQFTLNKPVELTVAVYSQMGSVVHNRTKKYMQGDQAESLWLVVSPGIYTLRISGEGVNYITQVIKN